MQRPETDRLKLDQTLTFHNPAGNLIAVRALNLELTSQDGNPVECSLFIEVEPSVFALIDENQLFNLKPEVRGPNFIKGFRQDSPVEIELGLKATLFEQFSGSNTQEIVARLAGDEQTGLTQSENWYALNVTQASGPVKLGYQTDWTKDGSPIYSEIQAASQSLFSAVTKFFKDDEWPLTIIGDTTSLSMMYQGETTTWRCIAEIDEEQGHFAFYSISPLNVTEVRRTGVAEYLTRANYGLLIGNFEMDYRDGEVRFRTSILVGEDEVPSQETIKQMVYANVNSMDLYLGGLLAVLGGKVAPEAAIEQAENS